jgi:hypothetical protein
MKITLEKVRVCFAHNLFKSSAFAGDPNAKEKFQGEFLIERTGKNFDLMFNAIKEEAKKEWGDKAEETLKAVQASGKVWCLRDGDLKDRPEYKGKFVVSSKNEMKPLVIDENGSPVSATDGKVYSGCYVHAIIEVKAGSKPSKQVYAYLLGVKFAGDGDRLSGSVASADDFAAIPVEASAAAADSGKGAASLFG